MGVIVKYKFDQTIYENLIPTFNSGFTDYTITDETDTDGFTIRTINNNSGALPTAMRFGTHDGVIVAKQKCLLDVISLDGNNINDMGNMFRGCQNLKSVSMSNLTSKVTGMNNLFRNCSSLAILNISNLDTSQVVIMSYMFHGCSSLTSLDTSNFNTSQVTDMNNMFSDCSSLTSLDVSNFNTEKVANMRSMFQNCSSLTSLDLSNFNTNQVTNMGDIFNGCSSLTSLDLSNFNTSQTTNMGYIFNGCSSLTYLNLSNFNTEKVTSMGYMFAGCSSLTLLDVSNFNTEKVTNMTNMFQDCSSLTHLDISMFNGSALATGGSMFYRCVSLQEIIFPKKFITNKCVNISATFRNCSSLKYVNVSDWDTSSVTTINQTFNSCKSLTSLDLSSWDTTNVASYYQTFNGCTSLQSLDISNFNILSSVTDTNTHITVCKKLVHVGMLYCNSETINVIANQIGGTKTIWYQDANLSDLTQLDNITYKKYQTTTLSLNAPIQLRSIGDVHDEINYETGEYIQRIGEVVLDGSEDWVKHGAYSTNEMDVYWTYNNFIPTNARATEIICDKLMTANPTVINSIRTNGEGALFIGILYGENITNYLQTNPLTVQFVLTKPIITKIDTTILDQNNTYKSSQQTYDEQTYVSVQSDTVVTPTSSVDYEIYSSTGTITGTSATIDNAEAGTPVSGVVYGETLLNVIQEPSEDEFVCTDNFSGKETTIENSVAGSVKDVIIKGQTLVNVFQDMDYVWNNLTKKDSFSYDNGDLIILNNGFHDGRYWSMVPKIPNIKSNTEYTLIFTKGVSPLMEFGTIDENGEPSVLGKHVNVQKVKVTSPNNGDLRVKFVVDNPSSGEQAINLGKVILIEGDYTNIDIDIPYFDGIGSVTNYRTIENMQSTCTYSENNGTYWCDTTTVNPTVGKRYFIKIFNNPNNAITRFFYGGVIVDTTTNYGIVTAADRTGMRLHFYNLKNGTVTITEEQKNAIRFLICEYQDGMENWEINEHFEESYTVQMPILTTVGKNLLNDNTSVSGWVTADGTTTIRGTLGSGADYLSDFIYVGNINQIKINRVCYVTTFDKNKKIISQFANVVDVDVSNCSYIRIAASCDGQTALGLVGTIQVEEGSAVATTYQPHKSTTVTVNENIELNSIGDVCDELNVTTGELTKYVGIDENSQPYLLDTPVTEKVNVTIIDQDNIQQKYVQTYDTTTYLKPQSYELIPTVEYKNPSYDVLLKPNTEYTIKTNRTNRATLTSDVALDVNLGGSTISMDSVTNHVKVKTPSILENNTLTLSGFGNKVKDVMVIEGDYVDRDLDFFEGFIHVENPIVEICEENLVNPNTLLAGTAGNPNAGKQYKHTPYIRIEPDTMYCIRLADFIVWYDSSKNQIRRDQCWGTEYRRYTSPSNASYAVLDINSSNFAKYNATQEDISLIKSNTNIYKPYQGNTLTTYPQVTLRSIGDIKDEWDVVGETVTRHIGEVVLDGSEDWVLSAHDNSTIFYTLFNNLVHKVDYLNSMSCDKLVVHTDSESLYDSTLPNGISAYVDWSNYYPNENWLYIKHANSESSVEKFKQWLSQNPITVQYELTTPVTEPVHITPPNPQTSTASITIPTQLNHVADTSDFLVWNPYKEHYVRYNYVENGTVLDSYTWENLTDLNERQFVEFYNRRTYVYQPYHNYVASHDSKGTSKYVLIEPNQHYTVNVSFSELPTCETVKVNLGGAEVEMNVNDPHVHVTTPNTLVNNLCSISGDGLVGKVTDILVIHCLEHEGFADIDYFEGIDGIGEIVEVDGVPKSKIVMEQTNGNLLDFEPVVFNNGNYISMGWNENHRNIPLKANTSYRLKMRKSKDVTSNNGWGDFSCKLYTSELVNTRNVGIDTTTGVAKFATTNNEKYLRFYKQQSHNGNTDIHEPLELTYAHFTDNELIRPRYYDEEEILLPIQLHRINTVYDNFYYDEMKGYYRIQQSIGHKYFVGADSENWTLIERGQRVLRFRYNNADIQMKSLGEFMTNILPNGNATSPYECCAFNGINFIVSIDKERLSSESLTAFKEWLANNNLHLYYQLASPLMIDLPQYPNRIEFNTYKDEIYTFFKNCKPTVFTLAVPLDQTYRFYELEQGEGYANRVELTDERMTEEDTLYIDTIYGSGIGNLIEEPNNVDTMLKPNYEGKATSHSLINGKVSTIGVHGFEPNDVTISNYNTVTKQYELTVQAQKGTNTNTKVLPIPYKFEVYEDGTKDKVYYNSEYKQWMFEGGQTLTVPYNASTGAFTNVIEVFRGLQPRSGLIGEFKVRFASGTTSARLYYSINGTTYGYTTLRGMTDEVDYYIGFFNTGGTKIDMGTKIDANSEYTTLVPINGTIPECLMINQIQSITECTYYQDKTYYYSDVVSPLVLDVYDGETIITELNGAVIDIQNNAHNKQALIYGDTTYTVYWTYVGGEGNIKVTLGGVTQEVFAPQGYVTITTSDTDLEKGLFIGGFNVTIKDLMLVKGERIENLKYFEGSRAVGTAFTDENGETMYKITLVTGSELVNDKFEEIITFEDNKKHNVVVTKLLGAKPDKI